MNTNTTSSPSRPATSDTTTALDLPAFSRAVESRDAHGQAAAYCDDARITIFDQLHPPSRPLVIHGTEELLAHFTDICRREMTHHVETVAVSGDRLILETSCQYPDDTRVWCTSVAGLDHGRIAWQRVVQAWDS